MSDDISIPSPTYRVPRHRGMDPGTRRLALIAAGIGGALVVVVGGWSMLGRGPHAVPVITPQPGPVRVKPAHPGGLQVQGIGNDIFSGRGDGPVDKLAPPPEVPDPQALRTPPPPPAPAPAKMAASPSPQTVAPPPATVAPPPPVPHPAPTVAPKEPAASKQAAAQPVQPAPAARPAQPAATPSGSGTRQVQLAALSTEAAAKLEWRDLNRRIPQLLAGHQPAFSKVEHGGHVFWRLRTGGFTDPAAARSFCQQVKAKGLACSLADF